MSYHRFNKGGRVTKSPFLAKSVQKFLNKKIKTDFFQKSTFFYSPITHKRFIFEHSYISYGKRQKSCTLIVILVILSYLTSPVFNFKVDRAKVVQTGFLLLAKELKYNTVNAQPIYRI